MTIPKSTLAKWQNGYRCYRMLAKPFSKKLILRSFSLFIVTIASFPSIANAQNLFYSSKVESLYNAVKHIRCIDSFYANNIIIQCNNLINGYTIPIILSKDENGVVDHIGCHFLPDTTLNIDNPIIRFVEREILTILLGKEDCCTLRTDMENGLQLLLNNIPLNPMLEQNKKEICSVIENCDRVTINREKMNYAVTIQKPDDQHLCFLFPADGKLISGMDKKEQEKKLAFQLKNHNANIFENPLTSPDINCFQLSADSIYKDSVYFIKGNEFGISQINNDLYYKKKDSVYYLVMDTSLLALTFSNTLLAPSRKEYKIDIRHRMYGFVTQEYIVNYSVFNNFFSQGYERYFGFETLEPDNMTGTLILYNREEEFIHLFYVTTTRNDLMNGGNIKMELHSNISQHNLKGQ